MMRNVGGESLEKLLELQSADVICVGKTVMFTFAGVPGLNPRLLKGQRVRIDGHVYEVLGAETYAVMDATGMNFGLGVKRCAT